MRPDPSPARRRCKSSDSPTVVRVSQESTIPAGGSKIEPFKRQKLDNSYPMAGLRGWGPCLRWPYRFHGAAVGTTGRWNSFADTSRCRVPTGWPGDLNHCCGAYSERREQAGHECVRLVCWGIPLTNCFLPLYFMVRKPVLPQVNEREQLESGAGRKCPFCGEIIKIEARVCRFCGRDLPQD